MEPEKTDGKTKVKRKTTKEEEKKKKVFMSFVTPDYDYAEELRQQIVRTGLFEVISFDISQQWHSSGIWNVALLHSLLGESDAFLVVFSNDTLKAEFAPWLRYEFGFAVFRANLAHPSPCSLVRVLSEDTTLELTELPPELMSFKIVDYRDPHSHELSLDKLVDALMGEHRKPSLQQRQQYVFNESMSPNPRREMLTRVFGSEFDLAFRKYIGPLEEKVKSLVDLQRAQDNLMTPEIISIEEANAIDDIWVVSHSLHNDMYVEKIKDSIQNNLKNGIRYTYFVPQTPFIERRRKRFIEIYRDFCEDDTGQRTSSVKATMPKAGGVTFIFLEAGVFMPFDELVVYDGESATDRWGYIQMNYDRPTGSSASAGLVMKVPDRTLNTIVEFLSKMKRKYIEKKNR